jgi:hypothetical protein
MENKRLNIEPIALTNTLTTNLLNCNVTSLTGPVGFTLAQPYILVRHMRAVNRTNAIVNISLWKGGTGGNVAGTEFAWNATPVPANGTIDWYGEARFDAADFLVGGAASASAVTLNIDDAEIGISG